MSAQRRESRRKSLAVRATFPSSRTKFTTTWTWSLPLSERPWRTATQRQAFASFSEGHAASSIARAWSAWDQFFGFLVAEEVVVGNPTAAVAKPKVPRRAPKALQGEATPERLLASLAAGEGKDGRRWPERDLAFVATALLTGLRLSELLGLDVGSVDGRAGERRLRVLNS